MAVTAVVPNHNAAQALAAYARPVTAPNTNPTQPPNHAANPTESTQAPPQPPKTKIYLFEASLGRYVNILV